MSNNDDKICAVCLEKPKDSQIQSCGHEYCRKCLLDLIKYRKNYNYVLCPLCRQKMTSKVRRGVLLLSRLDYYRINYKKIEEIRKLRAKKELRKIIKVVICYIIIFIIFYLIRVYIGPYICINYPNFKICNKFNKRKYKYKYSYKYKKFNIKDIL